MSCFFLTNLDSTSGTEKVRQAQQLKEAKTTKKISAEPRDSNWSFTVKWNTWKIQTWCYSPFILIALHTHFSWTLNIPRNLEIFYDKCTTKHQEGTSICKFSNPGYNAHAIHTPRRNTLRAWLSCEKYVIWFLQVKKAPWLCTCSYVFLETLSLILTKQLMPDLSLECRP